jgi:apolipoprotein N-acyltransferase
LGHILLRVSGVSFVFVSALATVAAFDHWKRSQFVLWKAMLLVSAIFAFFCYKRQLASVGDALLETQPEHAEKATIEPEGTGKL